MGLEKEVDTALKRFSNQTDQWRRWADISLTENNFAGISESMKFGKKDMAVIDDHIETDCPGNEPGQMPAMSLCSFSTWPHGTLPTMWYC